MTLTINLKIRFRRVVAAAAAMSLCLTGCATAQVEMPPAGAVPGPALWQLADDDTTIYLFGTVHALPRDKDWFDPRIERAFAASDELVTEVKVAEITSSNEALQNAGRLPEGQSLRALMSAENRLAFEAALVELGLPLAALDRLKPWFAAMTLSLLPAIRAGYQPDAGVEVALASRAENKRHAALETVEDQIALFDTLPQEEQLAYLAQTVEQVPLARTSLDAMVAEWLKGDADQLAVLLNAEITDPALYARLLTERNERWAEWIQRRLEQPGTVFVAVGAGHLAGAGSVQDQLRERGLRVQRIWQ